jgi:hypothetical protein
VVLSVPCARAVGRAFFSVLLAVAVGLAAFLAAPPARAQQGKEEASAKTLQKKAMEEDYLATEFAKAQKKLEQAIGQCGTDKCSPALRARLRRDLGVVLIGGAIDKDKGIASFVDAIKIDPQVALEADIKTKDLDAAFAEAKKRAAGGGTAGGAAPPAGGGGAGAGGQPQGDFVHTPAAEQTVRTPIPVYVEYGGEETLVRVVVRYKGFGMTEWRTVELKKIGEKGWGALLPCGDVQQGTTSYYLQGFNANNDPVATGGDRNNPYKVPVITEKVADPPHLPGSSPPGPCADTGDCPPNFPGCKKAGAGAKDPAAESKGEPSGKDGGEFCEDDTECKSNKCQSSKCTDYGGSGKGAKLWIGLTGSLDYSFVPSADDVCKLTSDAFPINDQNYYCVRSDGGDYPSRPPAGDKAENDSIVLSKEHGSDKVSGGGALGNVRLMLTVDYAVTPNILIGGRFGIVFNNYPGEAAGVDGKRFATPVHLELRLTYVLGNDPLAKKGLAPYFFGGAGIAQFETRVPVQVIERKTGVAPEKRDVDAWHIAGPAFIGVGGGARLAISPRFAFMFGLRANFAFLNAFSPSVGPEIGGAIGF